MIDDTSTYFSVPHTFKAYLKPLANDDVLPSLDELQNMQSVGLRLLGEVKTVENNSLAQLRALESDTKAVVEYLKLQSKKIDLILQYVLESEHQDGIKVQGTKFGGGSIELITDFEPQLEQHFQTTLFIRDELVALLAIATVVSCSPADDKWKVELNFSRILETDIELLVKASLSVQQKYLRARSNKR